MAETKSIDDLSIGFEDAGESIVMRRQYKKQFTPEEAQDLFQRWFAEEFLPWRDEVQTSPASEA